MTEVSLPNQLGRVEGRLGALESRVDRHEAFVGTKLTSIETKLDAALTDQTRGQTTRSLFRWVMAAALGASGWVSVLYMRGH